MTFEGLTRNGRGYKEAAELVADEILRLWRQAAEAVAAGLPPELPDGTPNGRSPWSARFCRPGRRAGSAALS